MTNDPADGPHRGARPDADLDPRRLDLALSHAEGDAAPPGDAEAARVHAALDRTRARLARHGDDLVREAPALPPAVLAGLDRARADERAAPASPPSPPVAVRHPATRRGLVALAAVAALLAVVVTATGLARSSGPDAPAPRATDAPSQLGPGPAPPDRPRLGGPDIAAVALRAGLGRADYGPLADPSRRVACLAAHGLPPGTVPAGAREVVYEGRPAVLFVLTTGVAARFRVLVVDPACAPGRPLTLADRVVGR